VSEAARADVAFDAGRFAFLIRSACAQAYIASQQTASPASREGEPSRALTEIAMKLFDRLFPRREMNLTTALERQRLARTMPGQTGAMAAARLGFVA